MPFKSIEDFLKEKSFEITEITEDENEILNNTAEIAMGIAATKYRSCAILPVSILTEGNNTLNNNSIAFYVSSSKFKYQPKLAHIRVHDNNNLRDFVNEFPPFRAENQTRHPYISWHTALTNRNFLPKSLSNMGNLPEALTEIVLAKARGQIDLFVILPQDIVFEGEEWQPEEKDRTAIYVRRTNLDRKDKSVYYFSCLCNHKDTRESAFHHF